MNEGMRLDLETPGLREWPHDAVMVVAAVAGTERREHMEGVYRCTCRDCDRALLADTRTIRTANEIAAKSGRPVKFFCVDCCLRYDRSSIDKLIDQRGGRPQ